jgi:hypothetical protein
MKTLNSWKPGSALAGAILFGALSALPVLAQTYTNIIAGQSPIDWWRFDETQTSPVINTVANSGTAGVTGTGYVVGSVTLGEPGIVGTAAFLSNPGQGTGNCQARIDIPNSTAFNPQPPWTVEFWTMPNTPFDPSDSTGLCPISSDSPAGSAGFEGARSGYLFYVTPTSWVMRIGGVESYTAIVTASATVSLTSFTYVVGEFDGTTASLYINGVLAASSAAGANPFQPNNFVPTRIGGTALPGDEYEDGSGNPVVSTGNRGWDGWVDEFAVYNTILSSNTIMAHYNAGLTNKAGYDALILASSPTGYWNLDEPAYTAPPTNSYTFAADSGSLADDGTNTLGTLADQPGVPGTGDKSVFYSGSSGSLVLDTNVAPTDVAGENLSLVAWIKPFSYGYVSDIIAQGYDETSYAENFLRVGNSFDWAYFQDDSSGGNYNPAIVPDIDYYEVGAYDGGPGYVSAAFPAPAGDIGHWVFLVGTFDGVNWNLYRNAQLVAQFPGAFPDGSGSGPTDVDDADGVVHPWSVGSRSNPSEYFGLFFCGSIAEPAIFTTTLDAATISNLYNSVTLAPVITQAPVAPAPAYLGSVASFSVWADGPGGLGYQWSYNNSPIAGQTGTNYTISNLTAAANGTYSVVVTNANGTASSSVELTVTPTLPPAILAPAAETRWLGSPLSFAPASLPNQQLSFQWDFNGTPIGGATNSSYTAATTVGNTGSYTLVISNSFGVSTSTVATLTYLTSPNLYVSTILGDHPLSFLRLDESSGPIAYDYAGGNNGEYFGSVTLGELGYSLVDTDTAAFFPGTALSYVGDIGPTAIDFYGTNAEFSVEAWANGPSIQTGGGAVIAKGHSNNGTTANEQFALVATPADYEFFVRDAKGNGVGATATVGPDGNWHHLVGVCDYLGLNSGSPNLTLYIDGANAAVAPLPGALVSTGIINSPDPVSIGAESSGPGPTYDLAYDGTISQVAIYPSALTAAQVLAHYAARYGPNMPPFITAQPVSATNYVSLPASLSVAAGGTVPLSYQWNQNGVNVTGATMDTLSFANLAFANAGTYTVGITNTITGGVVTGLLSAPVVLAVLPAPTNPPEIGGLVMHLTFDNTLVDATGRGNNATNEASGGAPLITNDYEPGQIGQAFIYQTTTDPTTNANYATLGVRPDLQFGTNSFSVSMWVQLPLNYIDGDLPFFTDVIGSTFGFGYCFVPSFNLGGWAYSIFDNTGAGVGVYGAQGSINDGNWHNLVYIIDRTSGVSVFCDGTNANGTVEGGSTVVGIGNINNTNAATIGQDPTGLYAQPSTAAFSGSFFGIDDLGVWQRALTPLEAASIYMAGISNQLSFVGTPTPPTFTLAVQPGPKLQLTWSAGNLQSTTNLSGTWTNVTGATSPYTNSPTGTEKYFRIEE